MNDARSHVEIYTDGGCAPNPGPGGWGAILINGERRLINHNLIVVTNDQVSCSENSGHDC